MKKVKALLSFTAYGIHAKNGQELEIERGKSLDLERLGWVIPIYESQDSETKVKRTTKKTT